ncbi:MAG TPA: hypothetical protein VFP84_07160 [Kofleriaceae bacterium]|nr:hypothetical protein [Kofleriaceae bacterium]
MKALELVRGAWRKLPVETVVVALAGLGVLADLHDVGGLWGLRLLSAGVLVTPLAFTAHRLGVRRQAAVVAAIYVGVLAALGSTLHEERLFGAARFAYPFGLGLLASLLVPFIAARRQFTEFMRRFFEETTTWGLLWGVAMAALGVIAGALDALFDLRFDRSGLDVVVTAVTAVLVLVYLDRLRRADRTVGRMPALWRRLAIAIGAPFVCVMLAILVVYEVTVIAHGEMPRNVLSPLILGAGFVGFVSTLIVASVLSEPLPGVLAPATRHAWAHDVPVRVMRAFPVVLLFLLPMAGWALWLRIDEYGLTPSRVLRAYGVVCLSALSLASAWRWWRGRGPLTWQVPAAIGLCAVAAAFGPLSAVRLSLRSQTAALARVLARTGAPRVVAHDLHDPSFTLPVDTFRDVQDRIRLLAALGGEPALRAVLTGDVAQCVHRSCPPLLGIQDQDQADYTAKSQAAAAELAARPAHDDLEPHVTPAAALPTSRGTAVWIDLTRDLGDDGATSSEIASAQAVDGGAVLAADRIAIYRAGSLYAETSLAPLIASPDAAMPSRAVALIRPDGTVAGELVIREIDVRRVGVDAHPEAVRLLGVALLN